MFLISGTAEMMFFLVTCFSFILLSKSIPIEALCAPGGLSTLTRVTRSFSKKLKLGPKLSSWPLIKKLVGLSSDDETVHEDEGKEASLLDLPELTLECILERLSPGGLCLMGQACTSMRDRCRSDRLWQWHLQQKWGRLIGESAYREWQCWVESRKKENSERSLLGERNCWWLWARSALMIWPFSGIRVAVQCEGKLRMRRSSLPADSVMALYLSLESGQLWFPAQVYNRENGHAGFMLSCYDAKISYDSKTDTFRARYSSHGRPTLEENIPWERLRAPPVDTPPHQLRVSDCLSTLRPGNHIEIQWRKSKEFPYGWWYGVVGHLESCVGCKSCCHCHQSDTVILEFSQYPPESRWRRTVINRKVHREEGSEANGFYGGIRKLNRNSEISTWKSLWPSDRITR